MFVKGNDFSDIKRYFNEKLSAGFSANEIKNILKELTVNRFNISTLDYITFSEKLSESDLLYYHFALKRILKNEPVQYVLGSVEFYGLVLNVGPGVLIPRPETEELVDWIVRSHPHAETVVDICTGSGCIAFAAESKLKSTTFLALELSDDALVIAGKNKEILGSNVELRKFDALKSDEYQQLIETQIWVSNPPYIPIKDKVIMGSNVLEHEPSMALFVDDEDPMLFYRAIAEQAISLLKNEGWLYFEIHEDYGDMVKGLLSDLGFVNIELRKDLQGKDRMIRAQKVL